MALMGNALMGGACLPARTGGAFGGLIAGGPASDIGAAACADIVVAPITADAAAARPRARPRSRKSSPRRSRPTTLCRRPPPASAGPAGLSGTWPVVSFRCRFIFTFDSGKRVSERGLERAKYQGRRKGEVSLSRRARSSHPSICRRREGSSWEKRHEPCSPSLSTRSSSTGRSVRQERPQAPRVDCERGFRVE